MTETELSLRQEHALFEHIRIHHYGMSGLVVEPRDTIPEWHIRLHTELQHDHPAGLHKGLPEIALPEQQEAER